MLGSDFVKAISGQQPKRNGAAKSKADFEKSPIMALIIAAFRLPDFNSPYAITSGTSAHIKPVADVNPHCLINVAI
ncbi:hypothetical protein GGER_38820 [Serratia rubidaea]